MTVPPAVSDDPMDTFMSPADDFVESPVENDRDPVFPSKESPELSSIVPEEMLPLPLDSTIGPLEPVFESKDSIETFPESPRALWPDKRNRFPPTSSLFEDPEESEIEPPRPTRESPADRDKSPPAGLGELEIPPVDAPAEISKLPAYVPGPTESDKSPAFPFFEAPVDICTVPDELEVEIPVPRLILPETNSPNPVVISIEPDDEFPEPEEIKTSPPSLNELDPEDRITCPPVPEVDKPTNSSIEPDSPLLELPVENVIGPLSFAEEPVTKSMDPVFPIELEPEASVSDPLSEFSPKVDGVITFIPPL